MRKIFEFFVLAALTASLNGCVSTQPSADLWVKDSSTPLVRNGFTLLPPSGENWMIGPSGPYGARFGKPIMSPDGSKSTLIVQVWSGRFTDRTFDLKSERGLREATEYTAAGANSSRYKIIETKYSAMYQEQATDCIKYEGIMEEHNNPMLWNKGKILLVTYSGSVCRHPNSPDFTVTTLFSERRPQGQASIMNDQLRQEVEHSLASVRFTPFK